MQSQMGLWHLKSGVAGRFNQVCSPGEKAPPVAQNQSSGGLCTSEPGLFLPVNLGLFLLPACHAFVASRTSHLASH